jgi:hypothetical protein
MYLPPQKQRYYIWVPEQNMLLNPTHYKEVSGLMQERLSIHRRADASLGASCRVHEEFHLWVNNLWCRWCEARSSGDINKSWSEARVIETNDSLWWTFKRVIRPLVERNSIHMVMRIEIDDPVDYRVDGLLIIEIS